MRQALHIFKKDIHYLWREICLMLVLSATLGWAEIHSPLAWLAEMLWMLAATFLIARVIHAEAIPGHNQFWITRPYRWKSMLGAKVLFILLVVNLPILAAQGYMAIAANFPVASSLSGLIWAQILMLLCFSLPIAALAAITPAIAQFMLTAFVLLAIGFIGFSGMFHISGVLLPTPGGVGPVEWIRKTLTAAWLACIAGYVLYGQYRNRRTNFNRTAALAGVAVATLIYLYTPWSVALGIQARLSKQPFDGSSLKVALDSIQNGMFPNPDREKAARVEIALPIVLAGIPAGVELQTDAISLTIEGADGRNWKSDLASANVQTTNRGVALMNRYLLVDAAFFKAESAGPVTVRGKIYVTIFGDPRERTISIQGDPVNVMEGLQCGTGMLEQLYCRSVFRWPRRRVYAKFGEAGMEAFTWNVSYSPFPAEMGFNPFEQHWVSTSKTATQATIIDKEPVSHFRHDFEIRGVHLTDFTRAAKCKTVCPGIHCTSECWQ